MSLKDFFVPELLFYNMKAEDKSDYFTKMSQKALELGYVNDQFEVNVKKREDTFPTGIQLEECAVAIPHTDAEYVNKEFIAVSVFEQSINFASMEDADAVLDVKLAFMLGLNQPHSQLEVLTQLMTLIQDNDKVNALLNAGSKEELEKILKEL
ncbi:PTS sugar transporter subunit IIA [Peptostreptococcus equinus]|uniref:PTS sugar transporter subunit IIA n=1 Tax=Peptostreptococcus equinus TaxID=3003601 RepID=A0ABY7JR24_9FIRM|nr:PTS sugar transporter subunit IIA [Peptostreptococcus sp. CBA3647]WAW14939.1 PTS sugar transporter subunit IIA [Peptostreptococcus sp. CBA3647]